MELVLGSALALVAAGVVVRAATRRRRSMARHPAPTFVFADLAGYTALTEQRGDAGGREAGARVSAHDVRAQPRARGESGQVDGRRRHDLGARRGRGRGPRRPHGRRGGRRGGLLPVRVGVHTGPAVMQGCDWYGSAVNVAARLAREAEPNQALVERRHARGGARRAPAPAASAARDRLRGVGQPISVWRLA